MDKLNTAKCTTRQRGAVLIVSLVFLTILTILGVTALNTSALQNTMASNFQFQIGAMEDAEVSVGMGEDVALDIVDTSGASNLGFEVFGTASNEYHLAGTIDTANPDWLAAGYSPKATANGEYVIEYAGIVDMGSGNAVNIGNGGATSGNTGHVFLISARSETSKGATRTLQTTLVTLVP
jgi:hypothetical protein